MSQPQRSIGRKRRAQGYNPATREMVAKGDLSSNRRDRIRLMNVTRKALSERFFCDLRAWTLRAVLFMTSSLIWVLIAVYAGFFVFLQKVMKD